MTTLVQPIHSKSLIKSAKFSLGGGTNYWCTSCGERKPKDSDTCTRKIRKYHNNKVIHDFLEQEYGVDIKFIDINEKNPQLEAFFKVENEKILDEIEHTGYISNQKQGMSGVYDDLLSLLNCRHDVDFYDENICGCATFEYSTKEGIVIDDFYGGWKELWQSLVTHKK